MQLSNYELSQLDEEELLDLSEEELRRISVKLLADLKEAQQEVFNNHSEETNNSDNNKLPPTEKPDIELKQSSQNETEAPPRKPGKQLGAKGFSRTQKLAITHYQEHFRKTCGCCQQLLNITLKKAITAFETIDLEWVDEKALGLRLANTKHSYYVISCHCGLPRALNKYKEIEGLTK